MEIIRDAAMSERLASQRLDIVRDCHDLAGTFPQNVTYDFVFWRHDIGSERNYDALPEVARALQGDDLICLEVAGVDVDMLRHEGDDPSELVERELHLVNKNVHIGLTHEEKGELEATYSTMGHSAMLLADEIRQISSADDTLPVFAPVDSYHKVADNLARTASIAWYNEPSDTTLYEAAMYEREREALVLRQLHGFSNRVKDDPSTYRIGVLMGSGHSFLSIAAHVLGANVRRTFLNAPFCSAPNIALRHFRLLGKESDRVPEGFIGTEELKLLEMADGYALLTRLIQEKIGGKNYTAYQRGLLRADDVVLRYGMGKVTPHQAKLLDNYATAATKFLEKSTLQQKFQKREVREALRAVEAMLADEARRFK